MNTYRNRRIRQGLRRIMGLQPIYAQICLNPNDTSTIFDPSVPGNVFVQIQYANGMGKEYSVRGPAGNSVQLALGTWVELQPTPDNRLQIVNYNVPANASAGVNVLSTNVPQIQSGGYVGQQSVITALLVPQTTPDLTVSIKSWSVIASNVYYEFGGEGSIDLSSFVPSSGNNRYVVVFIQNDYATVVEHASTARSTSDLPLGAADIQECLTAALITDTPIAAVRMYGGQTTIVQSDIVQDLRQLINTSQSSGAGNVVGPASSTDNAVVRFDGTDGMHIQNSGVIIDDSNNITIPGIETTQSGKVRKIRVVTAAGAVTVTTADDIVSIDKTVGAATAVNLPSTPTTGQTFVIHDGKGDAATNNITITPAAGNINGAATLVLNIAYASAICTYNGTQWDATIAEAGSTATGNVSGPGSSTDRAIATWNGTAGTTLFDNPNATIDSSGNLTAASIIGGIIKQTSPASTTLASDAFTFSKSYHILTPETGTTDNLSTISGGAQGDFVVLRAASGNTIVVQHSGGNITLNDGINFTVANSALLILFNYDGTHWCDLSAIPNFPLSIANGGTNASDKTNAFINLLPSGFGQASLVTGDSGASPIAISPSLVTGQVPATNGSNDLVFRAGIYPRNALINCGFPLWSRQALTPTTLTAYSDDTYSGADLWYVLTQTASVQNARIAGDTLSEFAAELKQNQAAAQRMGYAQIIEGYTAQTYRSRSVTFQVKVRNSSGQAMRIAIVEWTGTEDSPTSDIVNDWTSSTYTPGNFFITTTTTVTAVDSITPPSNTWVKLSVTGTISASANNIICFVWTEGTAAQNVTVDIAETAFFDGPDYLPWIPRPISEESLMAQRYLKVFSSASGQRVRLFLGLTVTTTTGRWAYIPPVPFRVVPSLTATAGDWDFGNSATAALSAISLDATSQVDAIIIDGTTGTTLINISPYFLQGDSSADRYLVLSAEL